MAYCTRLGNAKRLIWWLVSALLLANAGSTADFHSITLLSGRDSSTPPVIFGTSMALDCCSRYRNFGRAFKQTYEIYIEWVQQRGGLLVNGTRRPVEIRMGNDMSEAANVRAVFEKHGREGVNLWLSTYSSGLSIVAADVANTSGALLVAQSGASLNIVRDRPYVFNLNPPARNYMKSSFQALAASGLKTISVFYEASGGPRAVCSLEDVAASYGMTLLSSQEIPFSANSSVVKDLVSELKTTGPEVVFGCVYEQVCHNFVEEMLTQAFEPKALIFTVCVTADSFSELGANGRWVTGVTPWLPSMPHTSSVTGWSAAHFGSLYRSKYTEDPPYQAAAAWAAVKALGRAVELAGSTEPADVAVQLQLMDIETLYGRVAFDEHGQTAMDLLTVQAQEVGVPPVVVSPLSKAVAPLRLMPSLAERQCASEGASVFGNDASGNCVRCPENFFSVWNASASLRTCVFCPAGSSLAEEGICSQCPPGKVSITAGQPACTNCSAGYYADSVGQSRCSICPVGTFGTSSGLTQCTNCSAGSFNHEAAQTHCRSCAPGTISAQEAATLCTSCDVGEYAHAEGMTSCNLCQAGFTTSMAGSRASEECICPKDSYRDGRVCKTCGFLQSTKSLGAESAEACRLAQDAVWLVISMTAAMLLFMVSLPALVCAYTRRIHRRLQEAEEKNMAILESKVKEGVASITEISHPMVLTRADIFLDLSFEQIQMLHEGARDMGILTFLDSKSSIQVLRNQQPQLRIVFLSYQWLSWNLHGPNSVQFEAMRQAVLRYADATGLPPSEVYVWLDVLSIPQFHKGVQILAVNSLYTYASAADALIIVAPDSVHAETGEVANLDTYKSRVWTRMEQIAHVTAHSINTMLISTESGLQAVSEQWVRDVVRLFDGNMTCCRLEHEGRDICDKEKLVVPLLGVWFVLRSWMDQHYPGRDEEDAASERPGAQLVYRLMRDQIDSVFPKTFQFNTANGCKQRELFGSLISHMEAHLHVLMSDQDVALKSEEAFDFDSPRTSLRSSRSPTRSGSGPIFGDAGDTISL